jgi:hypothetical protein
MKSAMKSSLLFLFLIVVQVFGGGGVLADVKPKAFFREVIKPHSGYREEIVGVSLKYNHTIWIEHAGTQVIESYLYTEIFFSSKGYEFGEVKLDIRMDGSWNASFKRVDINGCVRSKEYNKNFPAIIPFEKCPVMEEKKYLANPLNPNLRVLRILRKMF